jgi:hypothetical protein
MLWYKACLSLYHSDQSLEKNFVSHYKLTAKSYLYNFLCFYDKTFKNSQLSNMSISEITTLYTKRANYCSSI